jgi:superoxide dismutase, Fe-Mn family
MITLCKLPYEITALQPYISAETLSCHHGKHHQGYVDTVNKRIAGTALEGKTLEDIIAASRETVNTPLYNQAAQVWNHGFFWSSLSAVGSAPSSELERAIEAACGSFAEFKQQLKQEAIAHFASGWVWVVAEGGVVFVETTHDAETMACANSMPLLVIDLWEHAYYLDYQNRRKDFVEAVVDKLLNWDFASANYAATSAWRYPDD